MTSGKTYYCSSPALDWRLSGDNTVEGRLEPDPLIYSSKASLERLYQYVDTQNGCGKVPSRPKTGSKQSKVDNSTQMTDKNARTAMVKGEANNAGPASPAPFSAISKEEASNQCTATVKKTKTVIDKIETPTVSPSVQRKPDGKEEAAPSTRGKIKRKWNDWEDEIMTEAIVSAGEKAVDWSAILGKINKGRQPKDPRSLMSIKMHYLQVVKAKMVQA